LATSHPHFGKMDKHAAAAAANELNTQFYAGLNGIEFLEIAPELAVATMEVRSNLCQPMGVLHGGALTTLADTCCALNAIANVGDPEKQQVLTTELKIHFLGNVGVGAGKVRAEARPIQVGRRLMVIECRIFSEAGKQLAFMTCTQMVVTSA
jgi:1,4-dihydroxy-2-naphthoyl-CoA hydrolase